MNTLPTDRAQLARYFDHTLLKPEATVDQIDQLCDECLRYGFAAACVNPVWVAHCARRLADSQTVVASVAGFPLGASLPQTKADEARRAIDDGAREIDMVVNLGALVAGDKATVVDDIATVVEAAAAAEQTVIVKVILETAALSDEQIVLGCRCAAEAQADYVKTSTGFHPAGGATVRHVQLLYKHASPIKVKAAGGIRDLQTALQMIEAGASRIGASASVRIIEQMAQ